MQIPKCIYTPENMALIRESTKKRIKGTLHIRRALSLVWHSAPGWTVAAAVLIILQGIMSLASLYLMKLIVDSVTYGLVATDKGEAFGRIIILIALVSFAALLTTLSRSASNIVDGAQAAKVSDHINNILHAKSIKVDLEYYENPKYYDTFHRVQNDAVFRPTRIVNGLIQVCQNSVSLIAIAGLLVSFSWIFALVLVIAAVPGGAVRLRYADEIYRWQRACTTKERQAWYNHWLLTIDGHAKEIRLFELGPIFMERYRNLRKELWSERLSITSKRAATDFAAQALAVVAIFGSFVFIAQKALKGDITIGDLVMYFGAFQQGQSTLNGLLTGLAGLYENNLFLTTLYEFLDLEPIVLEPSDPHPVPRPMNEGISFERVDFRYSGSDTKVLNNINLHIDAGQVVALVGENGSGKTTFIKLLCRLYDPTEGRITIDGIDLHEFSVSDLRRDISVIFQDYAHYNLTARENIWLGCVDLPIDAEEVQRAAERSGADRVVNRLERGYKTVLGKWFENGTELSIGEWQKFALARAFLRDSQVIILDEPTSSLDPKAEAEVFEKFRQLVAGKTAIIIGHRLATVTMVDCIYFFKDGRILEEGTHMELMNRNGEYARLFEIQAKYYK